MKGMVTAKEQFPSDDEERSYQSEALKALTLGVPAGWNKPAHQRGRWTCWKVAKTYEREAAGVKFCSSRSRGNGAEREQTQGVSGFPAW